MQISVVIPTYNRWPLVARAVESAVSQTRAAEQILVVDDGSTDDTSLQLKKRFGSLVTILSQPNKGVSSARNLAVDEASGDWIALLDSDDEWLPQKLEQQCNAVENVEETVLVHSDEIWIRNGTRVNAAKKHQKRGGFIYQHCLPLCCISPSAALINKKTLTALGGFDENLPACEDYDLWLRLCSRHPVVYVDAPLLKKYGGHEDQLSSQYWGMDRFRIVALEKMLSSKGLNPMQRNLTIETMIRKTQILLKGAIKHNNESLINQCHKLVEMYGQEAIQQ